LPDPTLRGVLVQALQHHGGIVLADLRVYIRPDERDPDLHYCVTWGTGRYAAGTLRWWPDVQRLAGEPTRLYDRFDDWRELVATIGTVGGVYNGLESDVDGAMDRWIFNREGVRLGRLAVRVDLRRRSHEPDDVLRSRLVNGVGGRALGDADEDPREGLTEEPSTPPDEPRRAHERLLDDDLLEEG
jgi:hypothetical protein